jgi:hypothetical protein
VGVQWQGRRVFFPGLRLLPPDFSGNDVDIGPLLAQVGNLFSGLTVELVEAAARAVETADPK